MPNDADAIARDPNFPDLPHFAAFFQAATGAPPSGQGRDARARRASPASPAR